MEPNKTKPYLLDGKQVQLSKNNNRLMIEVEDLINGKSFFIELDNDAIVQVSKEIFSDINTMYQGLEDALKNAYQEVKLSCDNLGFLTYKLTYVLGPVKKEHNFSISLQEKKCDSLGALESKMESKLTDILTKMSDLVNHVSDIEKNVLTRLEKLEHRVTAMERHGIQNGARNNEDFYDALSKLEKRVSELSLSQASLVQKNNLEEAKNDSTAIQNIQKMISDRNLTFDTKSPQAKGFEMTNYGKTIMNLQSSSFAEIPFSQWIPSSGVFHLSVKLESLASDMWIGFRPALFFDEKDWYKSTTFYELGDGSIRVNNSVLSKTINPDFTSPKVGDIVSLRIDADLGQMFFSVNGVQTNWKNFDFKGNKYLPYFGFYPIGGKVSIVEEIELGIEK